MAQLISFAAGIGFASTLTVLYGGAIGLGSLLLASHLGARSTHGRNDYGGVHGGLGAVHGGYGAMADYLGHYLHEHEHQDDYSDDHEDYHEDHEYLRRKTKKKKKRRRRKMKRRMFEKRNGRLRNTKKDRRVYLQPWMQHSGYNVLWPNLKPSVAQLHPPRYLQSQDYHRNGRYQLHNVERSPRMMHQQNVNAAHLYGNQLNPNVADLYGNQLYPNVADLYGKHQNPNAADLYGNRHNPNVADLYGKRQNPNAAELYGNQQNPNASDIYNSQGSPSTAEFAYNKHKPTADDFSDNQRNPNAADIDDNHDNPNTADPSDNQRNPTVADLFNNQRNPTVADLFDNQRIVPANAVENITPESPDARPKRNTRATLSPEEEALLLSHRVDVKKCGQKLVCEISFTSRSRRLSSLEEEILLFVRMGDHFLAGKAVQEVLEDYKEAVLLGGLGRGCGGYWRCPYTAKQMLKRITNRLRIQY